jgi:hypothetical protein
MKGSPTDVLQLAIAFMNIWATSSAWTWWTVSMPRFGNASSRPCAMVENAAGLK